MTRSKSPTREILVELGLPAQREAVWQALTEAREIVRWFAPYARTEAGPDGYLELSWEAGALDDTEVDFRQRGAIREFLPPERLVHGWRSHLDPQRELPVAIELAATDGGTRLRLVQSGFLSGDAWDDEFEAHRRGWNYELRALRHYLQCHRGHDRAWLCSRRPLALPPEALWARLFEVGGVLGLSPTGAQPGDALTLRLAGADTLGQVLLSAPPLDLVTTVAALDDGLLRLAVERQGGAAELWLWLFSWRQDQAALEARLGGWLDAVTTALAAAAAPGNVRH